VRDLLYQQSLICIAGVPGVGKSVLSYSLAIAIATGRPFLGLETTVGRVLYFDEENGPANMPTYLRWSWRGMGCPDLSTLSLNLRIGQNAILSHNGTWLDCMLEQVREFRPNLIICDTSSACFRLHDENDNAEASRVIGGLRLVQAAANNSTSILILRHARVERDPKGSSPDRYKMRGASAWAGASDGVIFHLAPAGNYHGLRPTYLLPDKTRAFGLRTQLTILPSWTSDDKSVAGIELAGRLEE
jgi:RecA-family ATPase